MKEKRLRKQHWRRNDGDDIHRSFYHITNGKRMMMRRRRRRGLASPLCFIFVIEKNYQNSLCIPSDLFLFPWFYHSTLYYGQKTFVLTVIQMLSIMENIASANAIHTRTNPVTWLWCQRIVPAAPKPAWSWRKGQNSLVRENTAGYGNPAGMKTKQIQQPSRKQLEIFKNKGYKFLSPFINISTSPTVSSWGHILDFTLLISIAVSLSFLGERAIADGGIMASRNHDIVSKLICVWHSSWFRIRSNK